MIDYVDQSCLGHAVDDSEEVYAISRQDRRRLDNTMPVNSADNSRNNFVAIHLSRMSLQAATQLLSIPLL